jgi:hypothetical protein
MVELGVTEVGVQGHDHGTLVHAVVLHAEMFQLSKSFTE